MKSKCILLIVLWCGTGSMAQNVGIGTNTPNARLEITAPNPALPTNTDGLLIPKIDTFAATNPTAAQNGMLVFLKNDIGATPKGFYYWDDATASWKPVAGAAVPSTNAWNLMGNTGTNPITHFIGTTDDVDLVFKRNNTAAGRINSSNTAFGAGSLLNNATGALNTAFGVNALTSNTTGDYNTAFGVNSLTQNTIGINNVAVGRNSLDANTTGIGNVAVGNYSLPKSISANYNTAIGYAALLENITGENNTAAGNFALRNNTYGIHNTAVGNLALNDNTGGVYNTAVGSSAMKQNTFGAGNSAFGQGSLYSNTTGEYNTGIGSGAGQNNTEGWYNVAIGRLALYNLTVGSNNIAIGKESYVPNPTGSNQLSIGNVIFGTEIGSTVGKIGIGVSVPTEKLEVDGKTKTTDLQITNNAALGKVLISDANGNAEWQPQSALINNNWGLNGNTSTTPGAHFLGTTDDRDLIFKRNNVLAGHVAIFSTSFGAAALSSLPVGSTSYNAAFGTNALLTNSIGTSNSAFGINALRFNGTGSSNTAVGRESATSNTTASHNTAVGAHALYFNATGDNNTAVGSGALQNTTNGNNTAIGKGVLNANNTGFGNSALGSEAMLTNTSGSQNVAIGISSLRSNTLGNNNAGIGMNALNFNTGGSGNVALGAEALYNNTTGANNIALGYRAGKNNSGAGSNNIVIGANAEVVNGAVSNQISIANLIYATGATGIANAGNIGIGTNNPTTKLEVAGTTKTTNFQMTAGATNNYVMKSDGAGNAGWVAINTLEADPKIGGQTGNQVPRWNGSQLVSGNITDNGWVGISASSPQAPLHISTQNGVGSAGNTQRAYFHVNTGSNIIQDVSASGNILVRADGWFWANGGGFLATSDARIKNIMGITNNEADLSVLRQIEITDYKYKDAIGYGTGTQKKVIAQQLQTVYPIAVNQSTGILPDIFEVAKATTVKSGKTIITTGKPHRLVTGDEVKLILDKSGERMMAVTVLDPHTFAVGAVINETVFVYGKKVNDLLNVDYDALTTLNISATQQLQKEIDKLKAENLAAKANLQAQIETLLKRLEALEKNVPHWTLEKLAP